MPVREDDWLVCQIEKLEEQVRAERKRLSDQRLDEVLRALSVLSHELSVVDGSHPNQATEPVHDVDNINISKANGTSAEQALRRLRKDKVLAGNLSRRA